MKYFLLLSMLCLSLPQLSGQFAIRAGINTSKIDFDNDFFSPESRTGIQVGATYTLSLSDRIGLRPGAVLSVKGFKGLNETGQLTYLEFPASLLFYILGSSDGLFLEVGPYLGAMLDADNTTNIDYKNLDVGLNLGGGIKIGRFGVGITYGYGLANIVDGGFTMDDTPARNRNIGVHGNVYF